MKAAILKGCNFEKRRRSCGAPGFAERQICRQNAYGIVFSGGGTCGAYQIGFWKALRECGLESQVTGISGSSVGAMNALLFAQGDLETAEAVWLSIHEWDLASPMVHANPEDYLTLFSQRKLEKLIRGRIYDWRKISSHRALYVNVSVLDASLPVRKRVDMRAREGGAVRYIPLYRMTCDEIVDAVLASAAIPTVYPNRIVKGERCVDGDLSDKTPFQPLARAGYDRIIILHLNSREEAAARRLEYKNDTAMEGKIRLYHLYPERSLGNFLLITRRMTMERMERGYREGLLFLRALQREMTGEAERTGLTSDDEVMALVKEMRDADRV